MPITPDEKDWTWVLYRPCPECGLDANDFSKEELAERIRALLPEWQAALGASDVSVRRRSDRWSVLEYACHVRDVFRIFDERLALMLSVDDARFANWDQDETAREAQYELSVPWEVALELVAAGTQIADRFDGVEGQQWQRSGRRSDGSELSVEALGRYMLHDVVHHLADIA